MDGPQPYLETLQAMEDRARRIGSDPAVPEAVWLLHHPPLYTRGTSAKDQDLLDPHRFPIYAAGRGGQFTYHGPGQRVVYVMLDLKRRTPDIRLFVATLEQWLGAALAQCGIDAQTRPGRVGLWVATKAGDKKIAAIGIRLQKWVSYHGVALNIHPDLDHFSGIVPCGVTDSGVTSLHDLGIPMAMEGMDPILQATFDRFFGPHGPMAFS